MVFENGFFVSFLSAWPQTSSQNSVQMHHMQQILLQRHSSSKPAISVCLPKHVLYSGRTYHVKLCIPIFKGKYLQNALLYKQLLVLYLKKKKAKPQNL